MKPRWQLSKNRIAEILEKYGLEVRMWDIEDGVFLGAIVDGYKPDWTEPAVSPDPVYRAPKAKWCNLCHSTW